MIADDLLADSLARLDVFRAVSRTWLADTLEHTAREAHTAGDLDVLSGMPATIDRCIENATLVTKQRGGYA